MNSIARFCRSPCCRFDELCAALERELNRAAHKVMVTATRLEQLALAVSDTCLVSEINELRELH